MRADLRFAGVALSWTKGYVESYAQKLKEMGYYVRLAESGTSHLIAYSYKPFTKAEMQECLDDLTTSSL